MNANTTKFNPQKAPLSVLLERGFVGTVIKLDEAGRKPTTVRFINTTVAPCEEVVRTFPHGLCKPLEDAFIAANFDPEKAPLAVLVEKGFKGAVVSLGEIGGKPSKFTFTDGTKTVTREFPCGMCESIEDSYFDPAKASYGKLTANGFRGSVLELGTGPVVGAPKGKPTKLEFKNVATGVTVVRFFPRGTCKGLEDGYQQRQGVRMRARPVIRTR